jgi:peptide/nickel transport system ATP-binding protein
MTEIVMETRDVHARFRVGGGLSGPARIVHAVNGVSLQLHRGEILGLVGESGCGKSTLSKILLGLQAATSGEVELGGEPLSALDRKRAASRVQPIFQDPFASLNARQTIGEIIGLPLRVHGNMSRADRWQMVKAMLDRVGLAEHMVDVLPHELSGGQRQRVAIARALILRPPIVICDEPTSALDVSVQAQILNLLMELQRELGTSYLLISHNLGVVEHVASRVAVMYAGRIVEVGETEVLFRAPQHPYTQALLAAIPRLKPVKSPEIVDLGTTFPNPVDLPPGCTFHPRCRFAGDICRTVAPSAVATTTGAVECHLVSQPEKFHLPAAAMQ